jgi:small subunit ribosomal protein S2
MATKKSEVNSVDVSEEKKSTKASSVKVSTTNEIHIPSIDELLKVGAHFGHETKRWNPKMQEFIFGEKDNIHIIDVTKTIEQLNKVVDFLAKVSSRGDVLFVGTKKQAQAFVRREAVRSGAHFVDKRWPGGLLTNFDVIKKSVDKLNELERQFDEGIQGRTKFEISQMKKEWARLDRLYSGIKQMKSKPVAAVIVDIRYDNGAFKECKQLGIPVVALVDTNVNPEAVDYPVPSNDDAIGVIELMLKVFADSVLKGNKGKGIQHHLENYLEKEITLLKVQEEDDLDESVVVGEAEDKPKKIAVKETTSQIKKRASKVKAKGILEKVQKAKEQEK